MKPIISTLLLGMIILNSCGTAHVKEPEYRDIRDIRLIELGILQSTAGIDLVYYNPNKFGVQISEALGDVYVDNAYLGRFGIENKIQVDRRSEFVVPAIIKLDMIGAIKNQRELFKKKEVMLKIEGSAKVKKAGISHSIPIHYERLQNIERFRALISN